MAAGSEITHSQLNHMKCTIFLSVILCFAIWLQTIYLNARFEALLVSKDEVAWIEQQCDRLIPGSGGWDEEFGPDATSTGTILCLPPPPSTAVPKGYDIFPVTIASRTYRGFTLELGEWDGNL